MRFKCQIRNIPNFLKLTISLQALSKTCWLRLAEERVWFVLRHEQSTQVWTSLEVSELFTDYTITSAAGNVINLEIPLALLSRALKSCGLASDCILRLTKRQSDKCPILSLTITSAGSSGFLPSSTGANTLITQEVPVRVLSATSVECYEEPVVDVEAEENVAVVQLPTLSTVRAVCDRLLRVDKKGDGRVLIGGNKDGGFRVRLAGEGVEVESVWRVLKPVATRSDGVPAATGETAGSATAPEETVWREARVDGREWVRVLKCSGLARRVVAAIVDEKVLVLYCYLTDDPPVAGEEPATMTVLYIPPFPY